MAKIVELQFVMQKPADEEDWLSARALDKEIKEEFGIDQRPFATEGTEPGFKKIVKVGKDAYAENISISVPCDIPVGPGARSLIGHLAMRVLARYVNEDADWTHFYVIAKFKTRENEELFRTVIARTEISVQIRDLRYRNKRRRKS